ncbi:AbrB/MazE/SpoVT family DNA-binding domain-containing protein [Sphingobium sp. AP50]|uniref:AbrB/MazE/SpoVT family DNA-binding domain-containing protein n=1 Tax=Sphingobium sp. AP50 TaxID=1884369 RepID=UPI0015A708EB|nr:AbrB/MazE/SpoVT family DNA-binding domain-containing protein [Sphingobium sp. AP50]
MKLVVNRDNRITVPAALRRALDLRQGDEVEFVLCDGNLLIRPTKPRSMQDRPIATGSQG